MLYKSITTKVQKAGNFADSSRQTKHVLTFLQYEECEGLKFTHATTRVEDEEI